LHACTGTLLLIDKPVSSIDTKNVIKNKEKHEHYTYSVVTFVLQYSVVYITTYREGMAL